MHSCTHGVPHSAPPPSASAPAASGARFQITRGQPLARLEGAQILNPKQPVQSIDITLVPLTITGLSPRTGSSDNNPYIRFTASAYRNGATGRTLPFSPSLRVKAGEVYL